MTDTPISKDPNAFGLWEGEVTAALPKDFDASLYYIGRIRTPWKERKDCPKNAREIRGGLHARGRSALGARAQGRRELQPPGGALLDGPFPP